jgi:hypothetical protein
MYKQCKDSITGETAKSAVRLVGGVYFPFYDGNTDYDKFKKDLADGAELQDAEGNVFTLEQAKEYLGTLP